ncbi:MAG: hypothetical protein RI883_1532 [Bacteroidota bacterium]|jgi:hypothetical protein
MKKILLTTLLFPFVVISQVPMNITGNYTQNFNVLANTGSVNQWTDNSTIQHWFSQRTTASTLYAAGTGSSTTGGLYSYGSSGSTERALGTIGSNNTSYGGNFAHGVLLENTAGFNISSFNVSYTMEQWRNGGNTTPNILTFWYKVSSSAITSLNPGVIAGWTAVTVLDGISPINTITASALDGNLALNQSILSNITIPGLVLADGEFLMFKWDDIDHAGNDHGLSVDDFSVSWTVGCNTSNTINPTACDSYTVPSGDETYTSSETVMDTIPNTGCGDSIITINLTIETSSLYWLDSDMDGYGDINNPLVTCNIVVNYVGNSLDCDDSDFNLNIPQTYYPDADGDGHGSMTASPVVSCANPGVGYATISDDCNDANNTVYPGAPELCDGLDNDCNASSDDGLVFTTYYLDDDNDGFGNDNGPVSLCTNPGVGYSLTNDDCNDSDENQYPGAAEILNNGIDENCDGTDNYLGTLEIDNVIFTIQPNPSTGIFQINFNQLITGTIECVDLNGKIVSSHTIENSFMVLDYTSVSNGTYILKIISDSVIVQKRIIIQK